MANAQENLNIDALEALQILECPVCLEMFNAPVFQCPNGHLICSSCLDHVNTCPTCRRPMPEERIRCLIAENLVTLKCPNLKWGCKVRFNRKDKADHVVLCKYSSTDYCRRIELKKVGVKCSKMISKLELPLHMKNVHKLTVIENNEALISQEINIQNIMAPRKWFPILFSAFDDHFFLDCEIIADQSRSGATIFWKCISAGSVSIAQQFFVAITLFPTGGNDMDISFKWKDRVISIDQLPKKDLSSFSLTMNTLRELTINKELHQLSWKINVVIQRNSSIASIQNQVSQVIKMNSVEVLSPIEEIMEGTYQAVSGGRWWDNADTDIVYSRKRSLWTRKVKNYFEYSFNFGQEVTFQYGCYYYYKTTVTTKNNKLIHRTKQYLNGKFKQDITEVEEFSGDKMLTTDNYGGISVTAVYKKVNG